VRLRIKGRWELGEGDDKLRVMPQERHPADLSVAGSVNRDELPLVEKVNERF